jgi:hypothetical protein
MEGNAIRHFKRVEQSKDYPSNVLLSLTKINRKTLVNVSKPKKF